MKDTNFAGGADILVEVVVNRPDGISFIGKEILFPDRFPESALPQDLLTYDLEAAEVDPSPAILPSLRLVFQPKIWRKGNNTL